MLSEDLPANAYIKITFPDDFTFTPTKTRIFSMDYTSHDMMNPFVYSKLTKAKLISKIGTHPFYYQVDEVYNTSEYYAITMEGTYSEFPPASTTY